MNNLFGWFFQGLGYIIRFCNDLTNNYALALLLFAVFVKVVLFPFGIKQQKNMVKQAKLRPREMAIRKKYAGRNDQKTQQKQQEEIMALYQEENFNPMGGCLPLLIQFPILIALYQVITKPLTYICQFSEATIISINERIAELTGEKIGAQIAEITTITNIENLGIENFIGIDGFSAELIPNFKVFGGALDLSRIPSFTEFSWLLLIPLFTLVFTVISTKINKKLSYQAPSSQDVANSSSLKIMEYSMPLISTYICFQMPATIGLYWIYQNILTVLQQLVLYKMYPYPKFTEEDYKAAEKAVGSNKKEKKTASTGPKEGVRSLHHIDDDEFEEIYGKKNPKKEESKKAAPLNNEKKTEEAEELKEKDSEKDIPAIKDDKNTTYKKKD